MVSTRTDYQMTTDHGVVRVETILFHKHTKEKDIYHKARKITYQDKTKKGEIKFISLLTNDFQMSAEDILDMAEQQILHLGDSRKHGNFASVGDVVGTALDNITKMYI